MAAGAFRLDRGRYLPGRARPPGRASRPMRNLLLAIDQGTSNTKALLVDHSGTIVARATQPLSRSYPQPGWVEQDPLAIVQSVHDAIDAVLTAGAGGVGAIAISNQRE